MTTTEEEGEKSTPPSNNNSVAFSIDESHEASKESNKKKRTSLIKRLSKRTSLRSSFFNLKSLSFRRSGGDRGADIDTLRGTHGPNFEGYATINRADGVAVCCTSCFGRGKDHTEKILLIKGPYLFVFNRESDPSPKYAIALAHMKPVMQPKSGNLHHMTIETSLGDIEWELCFQQENIAKQFMDAFKEQAAVGEAEEVRKRLGHEKLIKQRKSVMYAEKVGSKKCKDQPEKRDNAAFDEMNRDEYQRTLVPDYRA